MPHPNWRKTPIYVRKTWFKIYDGYERGKPAELTTDVWDGLIHYWRDPQSIRIAQSCSASCNTVDEHGHGPMLHSTGQKPHAGVFLEMAKETGQLSSLMPLYERTHKNKAGQFLDGKSEQIFNYLVTQVDDRQTQLTQQSTDGLPVTLSTHEVDKIYEETREDEVTALRRESEQQRRESVQLRNEMDSTRSAFIARIGGLDAICVHNSYRWTRGLFGRCSGHKSGMGVLVEELATTKSHSRRVIILHTSQGGCREEE
uniref:Uncharacterized protein n=1 Tax=Brassica oleracea var. oleracea TaxID=109376 RepID=A0A0D3CB97_BRAOL